MAAELYHHPHKQSASDGCHSLYNDSNNECCHSCVQITLLSVYKMDEATKKPTTDAAAIERFTVKLKKLAARQVHLQLLLQCAASDTPLCKVAQLTASSPLAIQASAADMCRARPL